MLLLTLKQPYLDSFLLKIPVLLLVVKAMTCTKCWHQR